MFWSLDQKYISIRVYHLRKRMLSVQSGFWCGFIFSIYFSVFLFSFIFTFIHWRHRKRYVCVLWMLNEHWYMNLLENTQTSLELEIQRTITGAILEPEHHMKLTFFSPKRITTKTFASPNERTIFQCCADYYLEKRQNDVIQCGPLPAACYMCTLHIRHHIRFQSVRNIHIYNCT